VEISACGHCGATEQPRRGHRGCSHVGAADLLQPCRCFAATGEARELVGPQGICQGAENLSNLGYVLKVSRMEINENPKENKWFSGIVKVIGNHPDMVKGSVVTYSDQRMIPGSPD